MKPCGYRYGHRRQLRCRRLAGHSGAHAQRMAMAELFHQLRKGRGA